MSADEVLAEQKKLLLSLRPDVVSFLTNKRISNKVEQSADLQASGRPLQNCSKNIQINDEADSIGDQHLNKYPNMNRDEPEKKEWMRDVKKVILCGYHYCTVYSRALLSTIQLEFGWILVIDVF